MKKIVMLVLVLLGVAAVNARIDASRECGCSEDCWCKQPGLRHFRWLVPLGHKE
jgi:hypothetical protein